MIHLSLAGVSVEIVMNIMPQIILALDAVLSVSDSTVIFLQSENNFLKSHVAAEAIALI